MIPSDILIYSCISAFHSNLKILFFLQQNGTIETLIQPLCRELETL